MRRLCHLVLVLVATTAASPATQKRPLPVPPIPPARPPVDESAPLPNRDIQGPVATVPGTRVRVQDFRVDRMTDGLGYTPGSRFSTSEDRRSIQTPGLTVQVPLQ